MAPRHFASPVGQRSASLTDIGAEGSTRPPALISSASRSRTRPFTCGVRARLIAPGAGRPADKELIVEDHRSAAGERARNSRQRRRSVHASPGETGRRSCPRPSRSGTRSRRSCSALGEVGTRALRERVAEVSQSEVRDARISTIGAHEYFRSRSPGSGLGRAVRAKACADGAERGRMRRGSPRRHTPAQRQRRQLMCRRTRPPDRRTLAATPRSSRPGSATARCESARHFRVPSSVGQTRAAKAK